MVYPPLKDGILPLEVMKNILSCVSVKDLILLRCTSQWWKQIVFHPKMIQEHLQNSFHTILFSFSSHQGNCVAHCSSASLFENISANIKKCLHTFFEPSDFEVNFLISFCNATSSATVLLVKVQFIASSFSTPLQENTMTRGIC